MLFQCYKLLHNLNCILKLELFSFFDHLFVYLYIFLFRMCVCVLVCFTKQINSKTSSVCLQLYLRCVNVTNDTTKSYRHKSLMEVTKKRQHNNYQQQASQTFGRAHVRIHNNNDTYTYTNSRWAQKFRAIWKNHVAFGISLCKAFS